MKPLLTENFGNPSSFHQKGQAARHAVEQARERIADFLSVEPGDIIFTSGGTEANNLAVRGILEFLKEKRQHLVVSTIEHQSVLHVAQYLSKQGVPVTFVPVDADGRISISKLKEAVTDKTALVSIMHVNNEVGSIQPLKEIAAVAHENGAIFHSDAVQSFGKLPLEPEEMGVDILTLSAHKIYGPKGAGALYIRKGLKLKQQLHGGHQEKNIRPGTENAMAIAGFGKAAEIISASYAQDAERIKKLRDKLKDGIEQSVPKIKINTPPDGIHNTLNVSFEGLDGETLLMNLDLKKIYASTGSACTAGSVEPSHVLLAIGLSEKLARSSIRFSLGRFTREEEIDYALREIPKVIERLRKATT